MSRDEIQRFIIQQMERGATELEAYRSLMEVLGVKVPKADQE